MWFPFPWKREKTTRQRRKAEILRNGVWGEDRSRAGCHRVVRLHVQDKGEESMAISVIPAHLEHVTHVTTFHPSTRCRLGYLSHSAAVTVLLPTVNSANTLVDLLPSRAERSQAQTTGFPLAPRAKIQRGVGHLHIAGCLHAVQTWCVRGCGLSMSLQNGVHNHTWSEHKGITKEREDSKSSCLEQAALSQLPREQAALLSAPSESVMNVSIP